MVEDEVGTKRGRGGPATWFRELDRLLRGELTGLAAVSGGASRSRREDCRRASHHLGSRLRSLHGRVRPVPDQRTKPSPACGEHDQGAASVLPDLVVTVIRSTSSTRWLGRG